MQIVRSLLVGLNESLSRVAGNGTSRTTDEQYGIFCELPA